MIRSITTRTALVATAAFVVIALLLSAVGPLFLHRLLVSQIDAGLVSWNNDLAVQVESFDDIYVSEAEPGTYWAILAAGEDDFVSSNLEGVSLATLPDTFFEPITVDLPTANDGIQTARVYLSQDDFNDSFDIVLTGRDLSSVNDTVSQVRLWGIIASLVLGAIVFSLTKLAAAAALRPMNKITETVNKLGADNLSARVPVPAADNEVASLATTMNEMLQRVEASVTRQSRFSADASHELRSPLASLRAQIDVAQAHPENIDTVALLPRLDYDVGRATRLVDDLLMLARAGQVTPNVSLVDLDDVVARIAASIDRNGKHIDTSAVFPVTIRADEGHVTRVADNLIANAVRHAATRVSVTVVQDGPIANLIVDDDGAGVAPEHRATIFEPFARLDEARSRDAGGTGLGLALVRELATTNNGHVIVDESPLGGARFVVSFPTA